MNAGRPPEDHQFALELVGGFSSDSAKLRRWRRARGIDRCESPLERQLALALSAISGFRARLQTEHPWRVGCWEESSIALLAQPLWGSYRPDFALVPLDWRCPSSLPVVVEVDGHNFHERTREQAENDRARDRFMTASGSTVLRFTGSEVWRDSAKCAKEVLNCVSRISALQRHVN